MNNKNNQPISVQLLARLKQHPELSKYITETAMCSRLYYGVDDRHAGAWSWKLKMTDTIVSIGSVFTMKQCLTAKEWHIAEGRDLAIVPIIESEL